MTSCLNRISLLLLSLGLMAALVSYAPAQNKDKKAKKPEAKKEVKEPEPKKEPVKEKPDVPLLTCKGHTYWVYQVVFSPDGKLLASIGRDRNLKIWDAANAKEVKNFKGLPDDDKSVAFLFDGRIAASAGKWDKAKKAWEGEILLFDMKTGKPASLKGHSATIESLATTTDGKKLASASDDQTALIWDLASGKVLQTLKGHTDAVLSVAFSKDGARIATAAKDKTVKIWDAGSGKDLLTLKNPPPAPGKKPPEPKKEEKKGKEKEKAKDKAAKGKGKAKEQKAKEQPPLDPTREMTCAAFSPAGDRVAASNLDGTVKVWGTAKGKQLLNLKAADGLWTVAYSPDGKRIAAGGWDKLIYVFDAADGKMLFTIRAHEEPITSVVFSPDGSRLASASLDQTVKVWSASPPKR